MTFNIGRLWFSAFDGGAGALCLTWDGAAPWYGWNLHLFVYKAHRCWGRKEDWYDGPINYLGAGWLFLWVK